MPDSVLMSKIVEPIAAATSCKDVERLNQNVGLWLSDKMADALVRAAQADGRSLSSFVRQTLAQKLRTDGYLDDQRGAAA